MPSNRLRHTLCLLTVWCAVSLAACGGGGGGGGSTPVTPPPPEVPSLPSSLTLLQPPTAETQADIAFASDVPTGTTGLSYAWTFGDGSTSTEARPTHAYARVGRYEVSLVVRNTAGQQVSAQASVQVQPVARVQGLRCSGAEQTGWCWQAPQPWGHVMNDLLFTDAQRGWMVGDGGAMLRTQDGGLTWTEQFLPSGESLQSIRFQDERTGWLMSYNSEQLWRTDDGGATWQSRTAPPARTFGTSIHLDRKGTLVVEGVFGTAISDDAAQTWRTLNLRFLGLEPDGTLWVRRIDFPPRPAPQLYKSQDGGRYFFIEPAWASAGYASGLTLFEGQFAIADFNDSTPTGATFTSLIRNGAQAPWITPSSPAGPVSVAMMGAGGMWARGTTSPPDFTERFLMHSRDGLNWRRVDLPEAALAGNTRATLLDGASAYIQDAAQRLYITRDAGLSWQVGDLPSATALPSTLRVDGGGGLILADLNGSGAGWHRQAKPAAPWVPLPGVTWPRNNLAGLAFFNRQRGLALRSAGLLDTDDGGRTWREQAMAPLLALTHGPVFPGSLRTLPDGRAWLLAEGRIYRSVDSGRTWAALPTQPEWDGRIAAQQWLSATSARLQVRECTSVRPLSSFCVRRLVSTDDGGASWQAASDTFGDEGVLHFQSPSVAVLAEQSGIRRTQDRGATWQSVYANRPGESLSPRTVTFADAQQAWVLLFDRALRSRDGGLSWSEVPLPLETQVRFRGQDSRNIGDLQFADSRNGWIVGVNGQVLATTDGGTTWVKQRSGTQNNLTSIAVLDRTAVWLAGDNSTILATGSGGR